MQTISGLNLKYMFSFSFWFIYQQTLKCPCCRFFAFVKISYRFIFLGVSLDTVNHSVYKSISAAYSSLNQPHPLPLINAIIKLNHLFCFIWLICLLCSFNSFFSSSSRLTLILLSLCRAWDCCSLGLSHF